MVQAFPIWVLVLDYVLGAIMWTLIGRFAMGLFLPEDSSWFRWLWRYRHVSISW